MHLDAARRLCELSNSADGDPREICFPPHPLTAHFRYEGPDGSKTAVLYEAQEINDLSAEIPLIAKGKFSASSL